MAETKEVLALLKDKAEAADKQIKVSPLSLRATIYEAGGPHQVLPDGVTIAALHNQFIGNYQGLIELSRVLENRKAELIDLIKQQQQAEQDKHQ